MHDSSTQEIAKKCPSCRQTDYTSFSTCRFCHTRYDAVIKDTGGGLDYRMMASVCVFFLVVGWSFYGQNFVHQQRQKQLAPLTASVKASHRPRVMEFYAHWCGACNYYEPIIAAAQSKYQSRVDFQRFDVDDSASQEKAALIGVSSIPRTCIFDRNGDIVFDRAGVVSEDQLSEILNKL
ncbi:MAG TPA: thioredoxin domain-containing protein [Oculatellaceae cyanobacterium]